ncbi:MAG: phenylalanine--tRNA ligase subunit beta, partial [Rickettsiales bacterium]|nr:phenylalanine--tRNA ligase subunit beta [Rickettsiales bacterium]
MKFTLNWLKDHLDTTASLDSVCNALTMAGLEVESVTDRAAELAPFTIAEITEAGPHPDANKLQICRVHTGKETLQIVCGAPNARAGLKVVLAPVGTTIPANGLVIKQAKIRGVESNGMLCSATELGIGEDSAGIVELPTDAVVGTPFAPLYGLDDPVIEIAITPNRSDCLGVRGVARDLAAAGLGALKPLNVPEITAIFESPIQVTIADTKQAPRFIGRAFRGLRNGPSPLWLQNRLRAIGLRPISTLVDITNYLTYDLGRPAHVYDAKKLHGNLQIRAAKEIEPLQALDEKTYTLNPTIPVIADDRGPVAIGGVIGGQKTGCSAETTEVFLEIAQFDPVAVATAGRQLQIDSDARYRFERGIDPAFMENGEAIASALILKLCGGEASHTVTAGNPPAARNAIAFRPERISALTGLTPKESETIRILETLGCAVKQGNPWQVTPPHWRHDITGEADLVEEIARIVGYDALPATPLPAHVPQQALLTPRQQRVGTT